MRLRDPRVWAGVLTGAVVLYLVVGLAGRKSPGEVTAAHARESGLSGPFSCANCHGGWFGSMAGACLDCHEDIGSQVEAGGGLHGVLGRDEAMVCARCHSEHHGRDFLIVNRQSFAAAGVPDPERFDHAMVGYAMAGKHLELSCAECHKQANAPVLEKGQRRFLGLVQDCASCHEDPHEGKYPIGCAKCHGQEAFDKLASEGHERHLPLIGGHGDVACRTCHAEGEAHSLEFVGTGNGPPARACADCHASPHAEAFVGAVARLAVRPPAASCVVCHEARHDSFSGEVTVTPAQHACSGFPLVEPHHDVECKECHGGAAKFALRYPGRATDQCAQCHEDPHGGQFRESPLAPTDCLLCHDRLRFEPHVFTVERHASTALPLNGSHLEAGCNACHVDPTARAPRVFRGTPAQCTLCHADAHRGFFDRSARGGACDLCHFTTEFSHVDGGGFDHGRDTGFPIAGAHAQEACEACHPRSGEPDELGRTLGRVAERFGRYQGCASCHTDPHGGAFDTLDLPRKVDGLTGCARCHVETSFRTFPKAFDHGRWTGFPLQGAHAKAECSTCHAPLREPDEAGRTWARAKGGRCADCHADPHAGQFRKRDVNDCQRCHRSAVSFADLTFRHELDSRFRLGENHEGLACRACHKPFRVGEQEVVRYRPLRFECVDCHGGQKDPLRRRKGVNR